MVHSMQDILTYHAPTKVAFNRTETKKSLLFTFMNTSVFYTINRILILLLPEVFVCKNKKGDNSC